MAAKRRTIVKTTREKARIGATWVLTVYDRVGDLKAYESTANMWANEGIAEALNALRLTTINSASAVALISGAGYSAIAANDTLAGHPGWTEFVGYTGSRPAPSWTAASARAIAATGITFSITSAGTIRGAALVFGLGGTATKLGSMAKLAAVDVVPGDTVTLDIAVSIPAPAAEAASMLTTPGANHWLDRIFRSSGSVAALRVGFMAATPTLAAADAFGSHAGWTEYTDYSGSTRPAITHDAAGGGAIAQNGTADIATTGAGSIGGFFLTTNSTKGNEASGVILFTRKFPAARSFSDARNLSLTGANLALANFYRPPTALFSGTPLSGTAPLSVAMTDESSGEPNAWSWTATNGVATLTSTAQNPSFNLTQEGDWSFTLVASNEEGVSAAFTRAAYVSASAPAVLPPSISGFAISDATPDEDVSITFSATISNPLTEWILNPGDGSGNYSGTGAVVSQTHTYTTPGTYTATLSATGPGGSATPATISGIVVSAVGSVAFQEINTVRVDGSGARNFRVGLGLPDGILPNTKKGKLVGRYPNNAGGTVFALQDDNYHSKLDGTALFCLVSGKTPAGYTSRSEIGVGYSDTFTRPATPNWNTVTSNHQTTFEVEISVKTLQTSLIFFLGNPALGDDISITFADALGSNQTYSVLIENPEYGLDNATIRKLLATTLQRSISADPAGRYLAIEGATYRITPVVGNDPAIRDSNGNSVGSYGYQIGELKLSYNSSSSAALGSQEGNQWTLPQTPNGYSALTDQGFAGSIPVYMRHHAGDPVSFAATFTINRNGRSMTFGSGSSGLLCSGGFTLNYVSRTVSFSGSAGKVRGVTSGVEAILKQHQISGSNGKMCVWFPNGAFTPGEEVVGVVNGVASSTFGSATISGAVNRNRVTSGAVSADLLGCAGTSSGTVYFRNQTGGVFSSGNVLTDDFGNTVTATSAVSAQSNFRLALNSTDNAGSLAGTLPVIEAAAPRVTFTARYNDAAAVNLGGGLADWLDGPLRRQRWKRVPFRDGSNNIHPHLYCFMGPTWDETGALVGRRVSVRNGQMRAASREYRYDVTSITDGVTNFISGVLADYRHKLHTPMARWSWRQDFNKAFSDPRKLMDAGLIWHWRLDPTGAPWLQLLKNIAQGLDIQPENYFAENALMLAARGGYAQARPGIPLWAPPIKFDTIGGGTMTIGVFTGFEAAFWKSNQFDTFEMFEGIADNGFSAWPFFLENELQTGDWEHAAPHPYLWWDVSAESSDAAPAGRKITMSQRLSGLYSGTFDKTWSLWKGSGGGGGGGGNRQAGYSHTPAHAGFGLYLVGGEWDLMDGVETFGRDHVSSRPNQFSGKNTPKSGENPGEPGHVMGISAGNGNRDLAWPWRSAVFNAFIIPDRAADRKATWRRSASDFLGHFDEVVSKTWGGFCHLRKSMNSDARTVAMMKAGDPFRIVGDVVPADGSDSGSDLWYIDIFKSAYCSLVAALGTKLGAFDGRTALAKQTGWLSLRDQVNPSIWYTYAENGGFCPFPLSGLTNSSGLPRGASGFVCMAENIETVRAQHVSVVSEATLRNSGLMTYPFNPTPQPDYINGTDTNTSKVLYVPAYPRHRFYERMYEEMAELMTGAFQTRANAIVDQSRALIPPTTVDAANRGGGGPTRTYEQIWLAWGTYRRGELTQSWPAS
jgi:PKD repeat protein